MTDECAPSEPGKATSSAETVPRFEAEELSKTKRKWRVTLHPAHLALLPEGEAQPYIFFREDFFNKLELLQGMPLLSLKTPLKMGLKLDKTAAAQLRRWFGLPSRAQLAVLLKRRYTLALPIAILFVLVSLPLAPDNTAARGSPAFNPLNFGLGVALIALWAFSKLRPHPVLFLLDAGWFVVIAAEQGWRVWRNHHWWWFIWTVLLLWMAINGVKRYCEFRSQKQSAPNGAWLGLLAVGLLAGCAHFEPRPLSPADSAAKLEERSLTNAALKPFLETNLHRQFATWPAATWDFDMLTLAAFYYQPDLEVARAQWRVASAGVQTAGGRPNPTLNVTPGYNFSHINAAPGLSPWIPVVTLDVPIETAGKRGKRIAAAEHLSEAARINIATTAWQVRSALRNSLADFTAASRREALLQMQLSAQEKIVALLQERIQAGAISSSELALNRVALEKTRLDLNDAQRLRAEARERVAEAVGIPLGSLGAVELSFEALDHLPQADELLAAEMRRQALQGRSDILGALADYAASQAVLQLEIAKQYPDVHISPGYQFDQGDNKWSVGISVELPVLNQNQGPIAEAKARREETAARFNALQARVLGDIERAVEVYRVSEKNLSALKSLAAAQLQQRESVEAQFKAGAADQLDLLNAQFEFNAGEQVRLDGQIKLQQALGALEDAVQRPIFGTVDASAAPQTAASGVMENNPHSRQ